MDIERIREFIVLANTCNYQVASDILFTTSSTLSKHIAQMEKEVGTQFFDRTTRKVTLNDSGKVFLESAKEIVLNYDRGLSAVKSLSSNREANLTVSFIEVMRQYNIFQLISRFSKEHPEYHVNLMEAEAQNMNTLLHLNSCDFAFASRLEFFGKDVEHILYAQDELMVVVPKNHPLANAKSVCLDDIRNENFVLHNSYYESDVFRSHCQEHGFEIKPILTSSNSSTVLDVVSNSMAISILSRARCMSHAHITRVSTIELVPKISFDVYLLYLKNRTLTPSMREFILFSKQFGL